MLTSPEVLADYMGNLYSQHTSPIPRRQVEQAAGKRQPEAENTKKKPANRKKAADNEQAAATAQRASDDNGQPAENTAQAEENGQSDTPGIPVNHLIIDDGKIYTTVKVHGVPQRVELPYSDPETLLEIARKEDFVKTIKQREDGTTLILFKAKVELSFDNKAYNEYLQSLLRYGG